MPPSPPPPQENQVPLCVNFDGTLIKTGLFWEYLVRLLRQNPLWILPVIYRWPRDRMFLERQLARHISLDPITLPYNKPFVAFLREQKNAGRKLVLVTASRREVALSLTSHLGLFNEVLGSDDKTCLHNAAKLKALNEKFGQRGFDYAGNSFADLAVWRGARVAIVVNARASLVKKVSGCAKLGPVFKSTSSLRVALFRSMRPHQWVKNVIVFAPLIAAHKLDESWLLLRDGRAFLVFCLCASGVYLVNDLVDLDVDRRHPTKKNRPLAAGNLPLPIGLMLGPLLLVAGLCAAVQLSWLFAGVTAAYLILTTAYSWWVKQVVLLDVFFLAGLYTIRLVAGSAATGIVNSSWLLMFSIFIFLSLALVKRYVELADANKNEPGKSAGAGRGYQAHDLELVASLGAGSGYLAALVLALYVNSDQVTKLYTHQNLLLLVCPLMLYWISRVWLLAHRGQMHDDPVVFTLKDKTSYAVGLLICLILFLATGKQ